MRVEGSEIVSGAARFFDGASPSSPAEGGSSRFRFCLSLGFFFSFSGRREDDDAGACGSLPLPLDEANISSISETAIIGRDRKFLGPGCVMSRRDKEWGIVEGFYVESMG